MNEFLFFQVTALAVALVALWMAVIAIAVMVRGPRAGVIVFWWPIRTTFRLIRRGVGSLFIALGQLIRGGGQGGGH